MYRNRKGIQFSYKDTWSLDHSLSPIIHSALVKFYSVLEEKDWPSCPSEFMEETGDWDKDVDQGILRWKATLQKMIYAFGSKGPDIGEYNFDFEEGLRHGEESGDGSVRWDMIPSNPEELYRYQNDKAVHQTRVEEGRKLFAEHYDALWW